MTRSTFAIPIIIGIMSLFGLIFALIYDGAWHIPAWLTVSIPIMTVFWTVLLSKRTKKR